MTNRLTFGSWIPAYDLLGEWVRCGRFDVRAEMLRHEDPPRSGEFGWADFRIVARDPERAGPAVVLYSFPTDGEALQDDVERAMAILCPALIAIAKLS